MNLDWRDYEKAMTNHFPWAGNGTCQRDIGSAGVVAVVEDDPSIREVLSLWLELNGYRSASHPSGESLLQTIHRKDGCLTLADDKQAHHKLVGAVLDLNLNLPSITGVDLAHLLRQWAPHMPVAIITALNEHERQRYGEIPAGILCLQKPFSLEILENALSPLFQ
jgi:DNA-binding response OmpR family regulator